MESAGCQQSGPEAATFPAGSSSSSTDGQDHHQQQQLSSRTGTPTPEKLGFDTPALPPAPSGCLAGSIAAAEASGLRVLVCQLRGLDPGQPLEVRVLLDYSIVEVFFGTGEEMGGSGVAFSAGKRCRVQLAASQRHCQTHHTTAGVSKKTHASAVLLRQYLRIAP